MALGEALAVALLDAGFSTSDFARMSYNTFMKIAITGKGGVGKTTLSAVLSHIFASEGKKVIAVDADPDANLAAAFGISPELSGKD